MPLLSVLRALGVLSNFFAPPRIWSMAFSNLKIADDMLHSAISLVIGADARACECPSLHVICLPVVPVCSPFFSSAFM
jgi:hypothetical protein